MKTHKRNQRLTTLLFAAGISVMAARAANAGPLNLADTPLFLATGAEPNIMMMIDSSGSMENIVPDVPYIETTTYLASCPAANRVPAGTEVYFNIDASNVPRIRYNVSGTWRNYYYGTGSGQRCFVTATTYMGRLSSAGSGFLGAQYTGNYLNWYFHPTNHPAGCSNPSWSSGRKPCTRSRMMIAITAGKSLVDTMPGGVRAGLSRYSDSSGEGGQLLAEVAKLDNAVRADLKDEIDDIEAAGNTPLAETLADIGYYFSQGATNLTLHDGDAAESTATRDQVFAIPTTPTGSHTRNASWTGVANPISVRCQKSFAVLLTDGRPTTDRHLPTRIRDYTGDCGTAGLCSATATTTNITSPVANLATALTTGNGVKVGRSYESNGSDYLDDIAAALYDMDLRPDLTKNDAAEKNNIITYLITFADDQAKNDPLMASAATHGGGQKYIAGNEAELVSAFQNALADIERQIGSASSASVNSGSINSDTRLFQATFDSGDWSGQLFARAVSKEIRDPVDGSITIREGTLGTAVIATIPSPATRTVLTVNGTARANFTGVPFKWSLTDPNVLDANRKSELWSATREVSPGVFETTNTGMARVEWLRGSRASEAPAGSFRKRSTETVLGDIINSAPAFVGAPNFRYPDDLETGANRKYSAFRTANLNRNHMVYVGANDGMLHAFHTIDTSDTGAVTETMAFIPKTVFKNLYKLTDPGYSHTYYTDGSPVVGDAYINGQWRTMLVAGLNKGGQGVYALDITNPSSFSDANADSVFQWEFTDGEDADLGYTFSRPSIIRMNDGKWYAAFGNGYNNTVDDDADGATADSATGNAVLYFVDLETGELERKIDTGEGTADDFEHTGADQRPNGLSTPVFVDINGDYNVDLAYAGDLLGNLWKFDLSSNNSGSWVVANSGDPFFEARNEGHAQPITSRPNVSRGPNGEGLVVLFGTGKYIENGDTSAANALKVQTFYGLHDPNTGAATDAIDGGRADLMAQTITYQSSSGQLVRVTSNTDLDTDEDRGWYMDLPGTGEMQVTDSLIRNNHVVFTTLIPETDACAFGGSSWLMEVNLFSGARATTTPFDLNNNQIFDDTVDTNGDAAGGEMPISGVQTTVGITPKPAPLAGRKCDHLIFPGTKPGTETRCRDPGPRGYGRQSWRQAH